MELVQDLTAGSIAGGVGIVVGHPLDTLKVRLQSAQGRHSVGAVMAATLRGEGVAGLFKGIMSPVLGQVAYTSLSFAGYNYTLQALSGHSLATGTADARLRDVFIAGTMGGAFSTLVTTPLELIKCNLQVDSQHSSLGGMRRIVRQRWAAGGIPALYRGFGITVIRDSPASGLYFVVYTESKEIAQHKFGLARTPAELISGGLAGVLCWFPVIPIDVIKTRIQTDCLRPLQERQYTSTMQCLRVTLEKDGVQGLYKGAGPLLVRAFPVSAVTFYVYEALMRWMRQF
ncbi:Mitochondrial carnitine carrier [Hondaea fermentalgiana]|uniref:Mitochondrial carnitine carrier n=1 Tax=Hondaea fermentalgiana TaxID=2315210 RepID=A0A2R5GYJ1_9STRA|nr:Mitochondrial carnitine carrier [Hondaea fermentalgiana]|eukprot:GBG33531.1 Mitochondrial carnitine carrier [Hondaea fermentalgiana]